MLAPRVATPRATPKSIIVAATDAPTRMRHAEGARPPLITTTDGKKRQRAKTRGHISLATLGSTPAAPSCGTERCRRVILVRRSGARAAPRADGARVGRGRRAAHA